jgi:hypothetical protein
LQPRLAITAAAAVAAVAAMLVVVAAAAAARATGPVGEEGWGKAARPGRAWAACTKRGSGNCGRWGSRTPRWRCRRCGRPRAALPPLLKSSSRVLAPLVPPQRQQPTRRLPPLLRLRQQQPVEGLAGAREVGDGDGEEEEEKRREPGSMRARARAGARRRQSSEVIPEGMSEGNPSRP